jgi:hypothetical protein
MAVLKKKVPLILDFCTALVMTGNNLQIGQTRWPHFEQLCFGWL